MAISFVGMHFGIGIFRKTLCRIRRNGQIWPVMKIFKYYENKVLRSVSHATFRWTPRDPSRFSSAPAPVSDDMATNPVHRRFGRVGRGRCDA
jgi:hypothetical protein